MKGSPIPPIKKPVATTLFPSAEQAMVRQGPKGALIGLQVCAEARFAKANRLPKPVTSDAEHIRARNDGIFISSCLSALALNSAVKAICSRWVGINDRDCAVEIGDRQC